MDAARLTELLSYCHLTEYAGDAEVEAEVEREYLSATEYLSGAGVHPPADGSSSALYDLCVNSLVNQWYDDLRSGEERQEPPGFRKIFNQLKIRGLGSVQVGHPSGNGA